MCGAPVLPRAIPTTRFFHRPQPAAADVMDVVGTPPPSSPPTPSGCWYSSLEMAAAAAALAESSSAAAALLLSSQSQHNKQQPMMAAAPAAQKPMMSRRPPDRDRKASSSSTKVVATRRRSRRRGGPVVPPPPPPQIKTRAAASPTPLPLPPPAADVTDAGASAPSTATPSPREPPLTPCSSLAAASPQLLTTPGAAPPLPLPLFPTPPAPPRVEVRQVWAHNLEEEARLIESLLPRFPYVAVATELPGTAAHRPAAHALSPEERYALLRSTVDALDLVQLGLTLFAVDDDDDDARRRLPCVWEFNFGDLDVPAAAFGPRLRKWARGGGGGGAADTGLGRGGVVTGRGGYDVAYLVKAMFGGGFRMPATAAEFEAVARSALLRGGRRRAFDVREMARLCPTDDLLRRALDGVAAELNGAAAGEAARRAGYDSLVACYTFVKLREVCFDGDDAKLASADGILAEITGSRRSERSSS